MHQFRWAATLLVVLIMSIACGAQRPAMPPPSLISMGPLGGPTVLGDAAYGVTTGGGAYCHESSGKVVEIGCGTVYRFDRSGKFNITRTFESDAIGPFGTLFASPDSAWLYGTTGAGGIGKDGANLYRVSPDGDRFEVLARPKAGLSQATLDGTSTLVVANVAGPSATLDRITPGRAIERLATFPGHVGVSAPLVESDGSIAVILNDGICGVEIALVSAHRVRTLFRRTIDENPSTWYGNFSDDRCFFRGEPSSELTMSATGLLSLNPHEIIRVNLDGSREVVARLAKALGDFVGGIVSANGAIFVLSASVSKTDPVCTRLLRIDQNSRISVVHAFARSEGRCLPNADFVIPRLAVDGSEFVVATSASTDCATKAAAEPATCGSIVRLHANGAEYAAHDFVQVADFVDGGAPNVRVFPAAIGRTFALNFVRYGSRETPPFTLNADGMSIVMTDRRGRSRRIVSSTTGMLTSHVSEPDAFLSMDFTGQQRLSLDFPLPPDLPEDVYRISSDASPEARTAAGHPLEVETQAKFDVYIPPSTNADVVELRQQYLGKFVYGIGSGIGGACPGSGSFPSFPRDVPVKILSIERATGAALQLATFGTGNEFLSIEPLIVTFQRPDVAAIGGAFFHAATGKPTRGRIPASVTDAVSDPQKTCRVLSTPTAGTWQFERTFSLHRTIDRAWPVRFRKAAADGRPIVGMTHAMVAAIWGYPAGFGRPTELARLSSWDYGPFISVDFRGDRVIAVNVTNRD